MMLLRLSALCIAFGMVSVAQAVTLSVGSDKLTYLVGETVTLSVSGDGLQGATSSGIFGRLQYSGPGSVTPQTQTQKPVGNTFYIGIIGNGSSFSDSFNQVSPYAGPPGADGQATSLPADNPFSTITLIAQAVGVVIVNWYAPAVPDGLQLSFFGLTNAPGTSFTIVPEPATVALIGLGLVGLASWRRGRA